MNSNHVCELTNESSQIDICSSGPKLKVLPLSGPNTCTNESVESAPDCQSSNPASTLHPGGPFDGPLQSITWIDCDRLAELIGIDSSTNSLLLIDSRSFLDYNFCHIQAAVNICCSKIVKRRLQQDKVRSLCPVNRFLFFYPHQSYIFY